MKPKTHRGECIFKPSFVANTEFPAAKSLKLNHLSDKGLATLNKGGQGASRGHREQPGLKGFITMNPHQEHS